MCWVAALWEMRGPVKIGIKSFDVYRTSGGLNVRKPILGLLIEVIKPLVNTDKNTASWTSVNVRSDLYFS